MDIGIFSRTYEGSMPEVFARMQADGFRQTQYNLTTSGLNTMPLDIDEERLGETLRLSQDSGVRLCALSGTFNMIAPDMAEREDGIRRFQVLCDIAAFLKIPLISLCTGSKHPKDKWAWHEDNLKQEAWDDLLRTTDEILPMAEAQGLVLGVETEASNIVNTPQRAREYLDHYRSPALKIIMDAANLFRPEQVERMDAVLEEAFQLLGSDIALAHAKDLAPSRGIAFVAAGEGVLNFELYLRLLAGAGYDGPLVLHGLSEQQVPSSVRFLQETMRNAGL